MVANLTLDNAYNLMQSEQGGDDLATHLLCALPDEELWAVVSIRSIFSIAMAVAFPGLVPVCHIATVELEYFSRVSDYDTLTSVILDEISGRQHPAQLISFLECYNTLDLILNDPEAENGL